MTMWKWDADQRDPLRKLRIPVVPMCPVYSYLAALHKESPHRPTEAEVRMLTSFIEERRQRQCTSEERRLMDDLPFDVCLGFNTVLFHKYGMGDWGYRRRGWRDSSQFVPPSPRVSTRRLGPMSLVQVMDLVHQGDDARPEQCWIDWKDAHPGVFRG